MPYNVRDRVCDTTTTAGTGDITCIGSTPIAGYVDCNTALSNGDTFYYLVEAVDGSGVSTGAFEVGLGTVASKSPCVFHRTAIINSSNGGVGGSAVSFAAGTKRVHLVAPAPQVGPLVCTAKISSNLTAQNYQGSGIAIPFNSTSVDTSANAGLSALHNSISNTTRLTIPAFCGDSFVRLNGQVGLQNVTASDTIELFIKSTGGSARLASNAAVATSGFGTQTVQVVSPWLAASAGDYYELFLAIGSDTSVDLIASSLTFFSIEIR